MKAALENKMLVKPEENKGSVLIRMKPGRALEGVAGPGETAAVSRQTADYLITIGYATEEEQTHDDQ